MIGRGEPDGKNKRRFPIRLRFHESAQGNDKQTSKGNE
jgi:hypothetical protein